MKYLLFYSSSGLTHSLSGFAYCCEFIKNNDYKYSLVVINPYTEFLKYFNIRDKKIIITNNISDDVLFFNKYKYGQLKNKTYKYIDYNKYCIDYEDEKDIDLNLNLEEIKNDFDNLIFCGPKNLYKINDYIVIKKEIFNVLKNINVNNHLAVHFRNTDIKNNVNDFIKRINENLNDDIKYIYVATDDITAINCFNDNFKNYNINVNDERKNDKRNHFRDLDYDDFMILLKDIYICSKADIFIDSYNSGLSMFIKDIKNKYINIFSI